MQIGEFIVARTHAEFLNQLLSRNYKGFGKSGLSLPDKKWLWMIRLGDFISKSNWRNCLEDEALLTEEHFGSFFDYQHTTAKLAQKNGVYVPAFEDRIVFDIIEYGKERKYIFRGVFTLDNARCTLNKNVWIKYSDSYSF